MKKFFISRKNQIILSAASIAIAWLVWVIAYYSVGNDYVVPSFQDTFISLFVCLGESSFWVAFSFTLLRTLASFSISFLVAGACAALSATSKIFKGLAEPIITILRILPTLAVILILLIWTNAAVAPLIVTALMLFPLIYAQFAAAIDGVDADVLQMAKTYAVPKREVLTKIYIPQVSPCIFSQFGANISLGLKVMISAEVLSNTYKSLGGLMQDARSFLEMPRLAALTLVAVLLGLIIDVAFSQLKRINSKWRKGADVAS